MVLAVAVAVGEHRVRGVRLDRAPAEIERHVADMSADPFVERTRLRPSIRDPRRHRVGRGLDLGRHFRLRGGQRIVCGGKRLIVGKRRHEEAGLVVPAGYHGLLPRRGTGRGVVPDIADVVFVLGALEPKLEGFRVERERAGRGHGDRDILPRRRPFEFVRPGEVAGKQRMVDLGAYRHHLGIADRQIRKHHDLLLYIGEHRHVRYAGRKLLADRVGMHRLACPIGLERVRLDDVDVLQ